MSSDEDMSDRMSEDDYDNDSLGELDSEFDDDDNDQFLDDVKDEKPQKKAYEVDFKTLSSGEVRAEQVSQVTELSDLFGLSSEQCGILLRHFKWQKERLIERYMDNMERVLEEAGLGSEYAITPVLEKIPGFSCDICCDEGRRLLTYSMKCDHRYCANCYRQYLESKIKDEGEAARIQCPSEGCTRIVDSKTTKLLIAPEVYKRYEELLNRTYVDDKQNLRWCPAPECEFAIDCPVRSTELHKIVPTVTCNCGNRFCFGCGQSDHQPCPCSLIKKWLKKCEDDSETSNWISAHTKECPKCVSTIEKNGGCNHMTCRKCKHEFCWVCMGPWNEHGTSWYNCNRYEEKSGSEARDNQAKSRASLERYLHYYNRYANHDHSAKLDKDLFIKTEKKMTMLQSASGMSWIEVQYLAQASSVLQQCRQTLKWTYAFAFYLERNNNTYIFEDNQKDLEMAVEQLSELFEKPPDQLRESKKEMMDRTAYVNNRRRILLEDTAQGLKNERWAFTVDV
ncbi:hypothetical protein BZA05DRAFT_116256 [Tricharina praecox]|uniref:uncharacterized protein n=1 Tax=Tricharina praecox TaxID=43433 RepID=UPI00221FBCBE|nr:uncharacterized protein BZA05DRAFT_116256 [Tricharina praecox]KAI5858128.1 hypothetical protein BZA05DRAFT_116256 [Tricharina praecox]